MMWPGRISSHSFLALPRTFYRSSPVRSITRSPPFSLFSSLTVLIILSFEKMIPCDKNVVMISTHVGNWRFHSKISRITLSISMNSSNVNGHCISLQTSSTTGYLISKYLALMNSATDATKVQICSLITLLQLLYSFLNLSMHFSICKSLSYMATEWCTVSFLNPNLSATSLISLMFFLLYLRYSA